MTAVVLRGDAAHLPLPDESADLLLCSPPYFGLRSYTDAGEVYDGQIGSEATPQEYIAALLECTREWVRVLKPEGSLFVNLGDKFSQRVATRPSSHQDGLFPDRPELRKDWKRDRAAGLARMPYENVIDGDGNYVREKSLMGLPWRYALACMDELGLILRAEIIWDKPNGLPESVQDRVRRSHEQVFHFTRQPRYYAAVDEIRSPLANAAMHRPGRNSMQARNVSLPRTGTGAYREPNPLGSLPGSVWEIPEGEPVVRTVLRALTAGAITMEEAERLLTPLPEPQGDADTVWSIPSQPLIVPASLGVTHFAAFPMDLPRRIILGWSPPGICVECGEGRRPVTVGGRSGDGSKPHKAAQRVASFDWAAWKESAPRTITGYACACTPYTSHRGKRGDWREGREVMPGHLADDWHSPGVSVPRRPGGFGTKVPPPALPEREYHFDRWTPAPTRPAVVVDPFAGTGTTMLVASAYGRTGIGVDRSMDYARLARWRTRDPGERARALGVPKPPPVPQGQGSLFDEAAS